MFIISPVRTEKSVAKMEFANTVTFVVTAEAKKSDVKAEVEKLFGTKVQAVRMYNTAKGPKRAIVRLAKGAKSDDIAAKLKLI
ncbi:MAG: 50S ribosomal protein L23 [Candidatus ainarchaeum sp.]|nr:50S ribosomal protein L23 [Candidatus ainarchaeum sp.]